MNYSKIVKYSTYIFIAITTMTFVYTLGFSTDYIQIRGSYREFYEEAQKFNKFIFNISVLTFLEILLLLAFDNHTKIVYRWTNTIAGLVISIQSIIVSIYVFVKLGELKNDYLTVNLESVRILYPDFEIKTFVFTTGYFIYGLLLIIALVLLVITVNNTIRKIKLLGGINDG